jgi:opacity protein-like surface antigen
MRSWLLSTVLLLAPAVSVAQETGFYLGGSIGQMEAEGDCPSAFSCDLKDSAWKVFAGYRVNRHLAIEGTYADWGEISVRTTAAGVPVTGMSEQTGWGVAGLGILPLGDRFSLFGKLGVMVGERETRVGAPGFPSVVDSDDGSELHFGFGAGFNFTRNLGLRAEWERLEDSEIDVVSIGLQYRF